MRVSSLLALLLVVAASRTCFAQQAGNGPPQKVPNAAPAIAVAPATRPATRPSAAAVPATAHAAEAAITAAMAKLQAAKVQCLARLVDSPDYREKKAVADTAMRKLESVRTIGTAQEKLAASHDFVVASKPAKNLEAEAIGRDKDVAAAEKELVTAKAALVTATIAARKMREEREAEAAAMAKPTINPAITSHKVQRGMTEEEADRSIRSGYYGIGRDVYVSHTDREDGSRTVKWECMEKSGYVGQGAVTVRSVTVHLVAGRIVEVEDMDRRMQ